MKHLLKAANYDNNMKINNPVITSIAWRETQQQFNSALSSPGIRQRQMIEKIHSVIERWSTCF